MFGQPIGGNDGLGMVELGLCHDVPSWSAFLVGEFAGIIDLPRRP
jgi:hypothetical protein